jgi:hypothetical protein
MFNNYLLRLFVITVTAGMFAGFNGCKSENKLAEQKVVKENQQQASIVREGVIDLSAIDANKDGKVFQCPMDYNVIDDKAGICPQCKMDLEEVTIEKAKENLVKSDFKVK